MITGGGAPRALAKGRIDLVANGDVKPGTVVRWIAVSEGWSDLEADDNIKPGGG